MIKFAQEPKNLLITFAPENSVFVKLVWAKCKAGIKVGWHKGINNFGLKIATVEDAALFVAELI